MTESSGDHGRAIVLVDHGSRRSEANELIHQVVEQVQGRVPGQLVLAAHMELCEPSLEDVVAHVAAQGVREVVVVPYMLGPGRHASVDIPNMVTALRHQFPALEMKVARPLGLHPGLVSAVLDRADGARDVPDLADEGRPEGAP